VGFVGGGASLENYQAAAEGRGQKGAEGSGGAGHRLVCVVNLHSISPRQSKRERSAVALVINRYVQLWRRHCLLFYTSLVNYLAETIKNLRCGL